MLRSIESSELFLGDHTLCIPDISIGNSMSNGNKKIKKLIECTSKKDGFSSIISLGKNHYSENEGIFLRKYRIIRKISPKSILHEG